MDMPRLMKDLILSGTEKKVFLFRWEEKKDKGYLK